VIPLAARAIILKQMLAIDRDAPRGLPGSSPYLPAGDISALSSRKLRVEVITAPNPTKPVGR